MADVCIHSIAVVLHLLQYIHTCVCAHWIAVKTHQWWDEKWDSIFKGKSKKHMCSSLYSTGGRKPPVNMLALVLLPHCTGNTVPPCILFTSISPLYVIITILDHSTNQLMILSSPGSWWWIKLWTATSAAEIWAWISGLYSEVISRIQNLYFKTPKIHSITHFCSAQLHLARWYQTPW